MENLTESNESCNDDSVPLSELKSSSIPEPSGSFDYRRDVRYFCQECLIDFRTKKKYLSHSRKAHNKLFVCNVCLKVFSGVEDLKGHIIAVHRKAGVYRCPHCVFYMRFCREIQLKCHIDDEHPEAPYDSENQLCQYCFKVYKSSEYLKIHVKSHLGDKICKICSQEFGVDDDDDYKVHMKQHVRKFPCHICSESFKSQAKLDKHTRGHDNSSDEMILQPDLDGLEVKIEVYEDPTVNILKISKCPSCKANFTSQQTLKQHILSCHSESEGFKCQYCPAIRQTTDELNEHQLIHKGEFICDTCHMTFSTAEELGNHTSIHDITGKPFICFICSIGYLTSDELDDHLHNLHKNEDTPIITPQHLCTLCGEVFQEDRTLNKHLKEFHIVLVVGEISLLEDMEIEDQLPMKVN